MLDASIKVTGPDHQRGISDAYMWQLQHAFVRVGGRV
jgi:hypothetical protein